MTRIMSLALLCVGIVFASAAIVPAQTAKPRSLNQPSQLLWAGHRWRVTAGGMAGVAKGNPDNVRVDAHGYLHLRIVKRHGTWTAAELMSLDREGFGTYQWQIAGNVYDLAPSTVLGLFLYGPAAHIGVDGQNEIDVTEFSQWNGTCHCNADFTVFFPPAGDPPGKHNASWEDDFTVHGDGSNLTTVRMVWTSSSLVFTVMAGLQPLGTTAKVLKTETYRSGAEHIPQVPLPIAMNLWCFRATPLKPQAVVIRDFQYRPLGHTAISEGKKR